MSVIDSIQISGVTYTIQGSGGGGNPTVELTQAEYDALVTAGTVSADTYYIITDASAGDLTQYWTSAQTNSAITEATSGKADTTAVTQAISEATSGKVDTSTYTAYTASTDTAIQGKQDTLVSGTNIKTINNESLLGSGNITIQGGGGGGKAISAGTNISITTGETADTINCTLPIRTDGTYSGKGIILGNGNNMYSKGAISIVGGDFVSASTNAHYSVGLGTWINLSNEVEFGCGKYSKTNRASSTFGDGGNTLFSVGNGTADNARHNAFEIRQNGDIYITSGGTDIKLQDNLGGGNVPESRLNLLYGYGTSGGTDVFSWSTGSTSQIINDYVAFSKINNTSIMSGKNASPTNFSLVETSAITTAITSSSTDAQVPSAKAVYDKLGGLSLVKLSQSEYDNLSTYDSNTLYVIVN